MINFGRAAFTINRRTEYFIRLAFEIVCQRIQFDRKPLCRMSFVFGIFDPNFHFLFCSFSFLQPKRIRSGNMENNNHLLSVLIDSKCSAFHRQGFLEPLNRTQYYFFSSSNYWLSFGNHSKNCVFSVCMNSFHSILSIKHHSSNIQHA